MDGPGRDPRRMSAAEVKAKMRRVRVLWEAICDTPDAATADDLREFVGLVNSAAMLRRAAEVAIDRLEKARCGPPEGE